MQTYTRRKIALQHYFYGMKKNFQQVLLSFLHEIVADSEFVDPRLKDSGNIKSYVSRIGIEECKKIADAHFDLPVSKPKQIFNIGVLLGRQAKQKPIVRVDMRTTVLYFIGSEADVVEKLKPLDPTKTGM